MTCLSGPCPCLERKAPRAWSGRRGTGRERTATGDPSQALASELPALADSLKTATISSPSPAEREEHSEYDLNRTA
jgi:hypothetical protein